MYTVIGSCDMFIALHILWFECHSFQCKTASLSCFALKNQKLTIEVFENILAQCGGQQKIENKGNPPHSYTRAHKHPWAVFGGMCKIYFIGTLSLADLGWLRHSNIR